MLKQLFYVKRPSCENWLKPSNNPCRISAILIRFSNIIKGTKDHQSFIFLEFSINKEIKSWPEIPIRRFHKAESSNSQLYNSFRLFIHILSFKHPHKYTNRSKEKKTWQSEMVFLRPMKQHTQQLQEFHPYNKKQFFLKVESKHRSY